MTRTTRMLGALVALVSVAGTALASSAARGEHPQEQRPEYRASIEIVRLHAALLDVFGATFGCGASSAAGGGPPPDRRRPAALESRLELYNYADRRLWREDMDIDDLASEQAIGDAVRRALTELETWLAKER